MKRGILILTLTVCFSNYIQAQTDSNKNKVDTILIKHDPANDHKKQSPDSTNEQKKKPPVQKRDLSRNSIKNHQPIIL